MTSHILGRYRNQYKLRRFSRSVRMRRQFPQSFTDLYQHPIFPINVGYSHKNHGRGLVRTFPSNEADQAGSNQYVLQYYHICLVSDLVLEKFAKKLLGESEVEDVLHRLDRLTLDEARMTGTETLQIVHGLLNNLKMVIGGTHLSLCRLLIAYSLSGQMVRHRWTTYGKLSVWLAYE